MLSSISIKNYALIDSLNIDFEGGFNILTGETGAGKSIILGALGLIIGQRADTSVLRVKTKKCVVEGIFNIKGYALESFFANNELDYEDQSILRREITVSGTSRAFINDTPVNVKILRELGVQLVDIHSQHQNLELGNNRFQLRIVDLVAGNEGLLSDYQQVYTQYQDLLLELNELELKAEQSKADMDYFEFQFQQLDEAKLHENEQAELEEESEKLNHAEEIQLVFGQLSHELEGDEQNVLSNLKDHLNQLAKLKEYFTDASEMHERLESTYIEIKDIAQEAGLISEKIENNPNKLQQINERLDLIYSLQQKHRVDSVPELIAIYNELDGKIQQVSTYDDEVEKLKANTEKLLEELSKLASKLTERRTKAFEIIETKVMNVLQNLGIPNASFKIECKQLEKLNSTGVDLISFLFSANKNSSLEEISKVASGGEMSRLMLAIKTLMTDAKVLPTIIFDEIDTGISGEVAIKVGEIIKQLSSNVQVLNITHLPQIAAKGKNHYMVYKYDDDESTYTSIRKLTGEERLVELAKMLGGESYSDKAIEAAKDLLN